MMLCIAETVFSNDSPSFKTSACFDEVEKHLSDYEINLARSLGVLISQSLKNEKARGTLLQTAYRLVGLSSLVYHFEVFHIQLRIVWPCSRSPLI